MFLVLKGPGCLVLVPKGLGVVGWSGDRPLTLGGTGGRPTGQWSLPYH